ncbi:transcriptional regulator [Actinobacillus seminis]|nr:transcriptional regulator [Actinobacillus seminis]
MNALTNVQYINNAQGVPAFAVIPLQTFNWLKQKANLADPLETGIPEEVAKRALLNDYSALRAWREHLGLTQAEVAKRLGISQSAYSQQENSQRLRKTTRLKMATALGIHSDQLDF